MTTTPNFFPDPSLLENASWDREGEENFDLIRRVLEWGEGFDLHFIVSTENLALEAAMARLRKLPEYAHGRFIIYDQPNQLRDLPARLIETLPAEIKLHPEINPIMVLAKGPEVELEAEWRKAAAILNEQRNLLVKEFPAALVLMGPMELLEWVRRSAPDLWSIRAQVVVLPMPENQMLPHLPLERGFGIIPSPKPLKDAAYYLELAEEFRNPRRKSDAISLANLLEMAVVADFNKWELARTERTLQDLLAVAEKFSISAYKANLLYYRGCILIEKRMLDDAEKILRESLALALKNNNEILQAAIFLGLGKIALDRWDFKAARELYSSSQAIFEKHGDESNVAKIYHQMGMISFEQRNFRAATEWYLKAQSLSEKHGNEQDAAVTYQQLGTVAMEQRDFKVAQEWYLKSMTIFEKAGNEHGASIAYHQMGRIAFEKGESKDAEKWYLKSIAISEKEGDEWGAAISYNQMGIIFQIRRDFEVAKAWYLKAQAIFNKLGDEQGAASTYHQIGYIAQEQRDFKAAREWYLRAQTIFEKKGNEHSAASTYGNLGLLNGLERRVEESGEWFIKSIKAFITTNDLEGAKRNTNNFLIFYRSADASIKTRLRQLWESSGLPPFPEPDDSLDPGPKTS